jgi:hypothetical protein
MNTHRVLMVALVLLGAACLGLAGYGLGHSQGTSAETAAIERHKAALAAFNASSRANWSEANQRGYRIGRARGEASGQKTGSQAGRQKGHRMALRRAEQAASRPPEPSAATPQTNPAPLYLQPGYNQDLSRPNTGCEGSNPNPDCAEFPPGSNP